jgi:hypothetical protein
MFLTCELPLFAFRTLSSILVWYSTARLVCEFVDFRVETWDLSHSWNQQRSSQYMHSVFPRESSCGWITTEIVSAWRRNRSFSTTIFFTIGSSRNCYAKSWENHDNNQNDDNSRDWMRVHRFALHYSFSEFLQESARRRLPGLRGVYVLSFVCRRLSQLRLPRLSADQLRRKQRQTGVGWHTETLRIRKHYLWLQSKSVFNYVCDIIPRSSIRRFVWVKNVYSTNLQFRTPVCEIGLWDVRGTLSSIVIAKTCELFRLRGDSRSNTARQCCYKATVQVSRTLLESKLWTFLLCVQCSWRRRTFSRGKVLTGGTSCISSKIVGSSFSLISLFTKCVYCTFTSSK